MQIGFELPEILEILKNGSRVSKMSPQASQITENHDSDVLKSRQSHCNTAQNDTVAGYARSALDTVVP